MTATCFVIAEIVGRLLSADHGTDDYWPIGYQVRTPNGREAFVPMTDKHGMFDQIMVPAEVFTPQRAGGRS
jgi:hypothetical protein